MRSSTRAVSATGSSPCLDLSGGYPAYCARKRETGSDTIAKTAQKARKLQREQGELTYDWHDPRPETLSQLRRWKSEQYLRTGLSDIFRFPWTVRLLDALRAHGMDVPIDALTVSDCADAVAAALKK